MNHSTHPSNNQTSILTDAGMALAQLLSCHDDSSSQTWQLVEDLLDRYHTIGRVLATPVTELATLIPVHAAHNIHAAHSLNIHQLLEERIEQPLCREPVATAGYLCPKYGWSNQEQMGIMLLDTRHHLITETVVYRGNVNTISFRPTELLRPAVIHNAPQCVVWHNHPSGNASPSPQDIEHTTQMKAAADLLGIALLDHIIVAGNEYVSLREQRMGGFT